MQMPDAESNDGDDSADYCHDHPAAGKIAKQILKFFCSSISGDLTTHIATFSVQRMLHGIIAHCLETVLLALKQVAEIIELAIDTMYVTCDGATYSDAFFSMHGTKDSVFPNPVDGNKVIIALSDPPHLMKKLRNNLLDPKRRLTYLLNYNIARCNNSQMK